MTAVLIALVVVLAGALAAVFLRQRRPATRRPDRLSDQPAHRILFPFVASSLSQRALDAALRLARAEDATLVPVFLARVPLHLPLDSPLPRQSEIAIALQEAVEQRATAFDVPVDARVERGRTNRHALRRTIANERFDRIVISAAGHDGHGFDPGDVAWLLDTADGEIVVLRPDNEDRLNGTPLRPRAHARRHRRATAAPRSARRSSAAR